MLNLPELKYQSSHISGIRTLASDKQQVKMLYNIAELHKFYKTKGSKQHEYI